MVDHNSGTYVLSWGLGIFEQLRNARGEENSYVDLYLHRKEVERFLNEICLPIFIRFVQTSAQEGADGVTLADDFGTQTTTIMNPRMFREIFASLHRRIVEEIHDSDMHAFLHCDGNIEGIMPDIIDIGYDIIHPVEPMNRRRIAREFGKSITFATGINVIVLSQEGPKEVENHMRESFDIFDQAQGGFLLFPTNSVTPDVSLENIEAMFRTAWRLAKRRKTRDTKDSHDR